MTALFIAMQILGVLALVLGLAVIAAAAAAVYVIGSTLLGLIDSLLG